MRQIRLLVLVLTLIAFIGAACKSMNKTQKGAAIGVGAGAAMGAVIGKASGNTAMGAIIGAAAGGAAGAIIGHKMDKQAKEIENEVHDAKVERVGEGIVVEFNSKVLFGFDRSDLTDQATGNLNQLIKVLQKYPDTNIEIQGHTDNVGTEDYNQDLSERRATSVAGYLRTNSILSSRISTRGYGEKAPGYSNDSEIGRSQNRRVDFLITANEKMKEDAKREAAGRP
jgi:outer membrane protein OmpA-like peptidoglycan-associated protein